MVPPRTSSEHRRSRDDAYTNNKFADYSLIEDPRFDVVIALWWLVVGAVAPQFSEHVTYNGSEQAKRGAIWIIAIPSCHQHQSANDYDHNSGCSSNVLGVSIAQCPKVRKQE